MDNKINELEKIGLFSTKVNKHNPELLTYDFMPFSDFKFGLEHGKTIDFGFSDFVNLVYDRYITNPFMMDKKHRKISYKQYMESKRIVEMYEKNIRLVNDFKRLSDCDISVRLSTVLKYMDVETIGELRKFYEENGRNGILKFRGVGKLTIYEIDNLLGITVENGG